MGWETRKGKRYYYRKVRGEEGRIRSVYCGGGELGEEAAREDELRRKERRAARRTAKPTKAVTPQPAEAAAPVPAAEHQAAVPEPVLLAEPQPSPLASPLIDAAEEESGPSAKELRRRWGKFMGPPAAQRKW